MFIKKDCYYFYIDNTKSINFNLIKRNLNIVIIYRNNLENENINNLIKFIKICKRKKIKVYVANNYILAKKCKSDGLYISAFNKKIYHNIKTIGSAHNHREIQQKVKQKCNTIILSKLFRVNYKYEKFFLGIIKFNLICKNYNINIIPLGGIKSSNLLQTKLLNTKGFACLSEIKKKPAFLSRLF